MFEAMSAAEVVGLASRFDSPPTLLLDVLVYQFQVHVIPEGDVPVKRFTATVALDYVCRVFSYHIFLVLV